MRINFRLRPPDTKNWLVEKDWWWERLKAVREWERWERQRENVREWDGWMASPTQWTWIWADSRSSLWTGKPGVVQSMASQESDMTEWLNWMLENFSNPHLQYDQILLSIRLIYFFIGFLEAQFYWAMQQQLKAEKQTVKPVLSFLKHYSSADAQEGL